MKFLFNYIFNNNRILTLAFLSSLVLHTGVYIGYVTFPSDIEVSEEQLVVNIIDTRISGDSNYLDRILQSAKHIKTNPEKHFTIYKGFITPSDMLKSKINTVGGQDHKANKSSKKANKVVQKTKTKYRGTNKQNNKSNSRSNSTNNMNGKGTSRDANDSSSSESKSSDSDIKNPGKNSSTQSDNKTNTKDGSSVKTSDDRNTKSKKNKEIKREKEDDTIDKQDDWVDNTLKEMIRNNPEIVKQLKERSEKLSSKRKERITSVNKKSSSHHLPDPSTKKQVTEKRRTKIAKRENETNKKPPQPLNTAKLLNNIRKLSNFKGVGASSEDKDNFMKTLSTFGQEYKTGKVPKSFNTVINFDLKKRQVKIKESSGNHLSNKRILTIYKKVIQGVGITQLIQLFGVPENLDYHLSVDEQFLKVFIEWEDSSSRAAQEKAKLYTKLMNKFSGQGEPLAVIVKKHFKCFSDGRRVVLKCDIPTNTAMNYLDKVHTYFQNVESK